MQALLTTAKKREVKLLIRENAWPINSTIRSQLWPALCSQHQVGKSMLEGYYWDMVNQVWKISEIAPNICLLNVSLVCFWLEHLLRKPRGRPTNQPPHFMYSNYAMFFFLMSQVFGTTELPEKPIMLPPFVDSTHCLPYHLTRKGRAVADRVVSVLAYVCPDITYSPSLYPIAALLLHFMSGMCKLKIDSDQAMSRVGEFSWLACVIYAD